MEDLITIVAEIILLMHRGTHFNELTTYIKGRVSVDEDLLKHTVCELYRIQREIEGA